MALVAVAVLVGETTAVAVEVTTVAYGFTKDFKFVSGIFSLLTSFFPQAGRRRALERARTQSRCVVLVFKGVLPIQNPTGAYFNQVAGPCEGKRCKGG